MVVVAAAAAVVVVVVVVASTRGAQRWAQWWGKGRRPLAHSVFAPRVHVRRCCSDAEERHVAPRVAAHHPLVGCISVAHHHEGELDPLSACERRLRLKPVEGRLEDALDGGPQRGVRDVCRIPTRTRHPS